MHFRNVDVRRIDAGTLVRLLGDAPGGAATQLIEKVGLFDVTAIVSLDNMGRHNHIVTQPVTGRGPESGVNESYTLAIESNVLHIDFGDELTRWVAVPSTSGQLAGSCRS